MAWQLHQQPAREVQKACMDADCNFYKGHVLTSSGSGDLHADRQWQRRGGS